MSSDEMSSGIMVPLNRRLTNEELSAWSEDLYDQNSRVRFNYEGTLAYTDEGGEAYGLTFGDMPTYEGEDNFSDLVQYGLWVKSEQARPYKCLWYNGADSDMAMMTLEDFSARTKQNG